MRDSVIARFGAEFPYMQLAAELLDPLTTHRASNWNSDHRTKVTNFLLKWMDLLTPTAATSTNAKWPSMSPELLATSRNLANHAELSRVGAELDVFNAQLQACPDRVNVRSTPTPCNPL